MAVISTSCGFVVTPVCIRPAAVLNNRIMGMIGNKHLTSHSSTSK